MSRLEKSGMKFLAAEVYNASLSLGNEAMTSWSQAKTLNTMLTSDVHL